MATTKCRHTAETDWAYGEIGRRAGFRFQWRNPSEFESLYAHHYLIPSGVRSV